MGKEVTEIINTLCEKLGVAANILVPEMARYSIARLVFLMVAYGIIAVVVVTIIVRLAKFFFNSNKLAVDERAIAFFMTSLIPALVLIFLCIVTILTTADLIGWIASPTASAVKEITSMIK